ncbi:helix-turn-helix domain-containing protein [Niabella beijingensis]|uniref:helix-turn-helix domain-containing protein n=1 Tax=Niabella beijingensis TaxID=2872700 RepID=UPI001CC1874A|nr:AraC family transcriptional regulator [Niabella beijingensis]MBZ4191603.1 AraC family transcriptional regulator [Niabella beijingensis]
MEQTKEYPSLNFSEIQQFLNRYTDVIYLEMKGDNYQCHFPTRHDYFVLMLFENGAGINTIDGVGYNIAPLQMHLYFPEQIHHWSLDGDTLVHEILLSRKLFEVFSNLLKYPYYYYKQNPVVDLPRDTFYKLVHELKSIGDELSIQRGLLEIINYRLFIISLMVSREIYTTFPAEDRLAIPPIIIRFMDLVMLHFKEERSVRFYADKLFLSPNYLTILCKQYYGNTASAIIHSEVILEIKHQLINPIKSIKAIAYDLNFTGISSLSGFFKNNTGMSPKAFREEHIKKLQQVKEHKPVLFAK